MLWQNRVAPSSRHQANVKVQVNDLPYFGLLKGPRFSHVISSN